MGILSFLTSFFSQSSSDDPKKSPIPKVVAEEFQNLPDEEWLKRTESMQASGAYLSDAELTKLADEALNAHLSKDGS